MVGDEYFSLPQFLLHLPEEFYIAPLRHLNCYRIPSSAKISESIASLQYRERQYLSKSNILKTLFSIYESDCAPLKE